MQYYLEIQSCYGGVKWIRHYNEGDLSHFISTLVCQKGGVMLNKESIEEYQRIMKEHYGEEISFEEAREQRENLVSFFELLIETDRKPKNN